jgi:hypothetical protein
MLTRWRRMTFGFWGAVRLGIAGLFGRTSLHFADPLLHLLARFERDHKLLWHKDLITRSWVASLACGPPFHLKNAEVSQLDAVVFHQRLNNCVERFLDDFLSLELSEPNLFGDGFDNLFLGHDGVPYETSQIDEARSKMAASLMSQV